MSIQIHGKTYTLVSERVAMVHSSGKSFEVVASEPICMGDRWVWRCTVLIDGQRFMGSAEVHLNAKPGSADFTDCAACAETSALGRALGFANFGAIESIASADEITRSQPQASGPVARLGSIKKQCRQLGLAHDVPTWDSWKVKVLGADVADGELSDAHLDAMQEQLDLRPD